MKHTLALITALLLAPLTTLQAASAARPNILHIHADDHRADGARALGTPLLQTPNLDSLVERGMTFTRCYTCRGDVCGLSGRGVDAVAQEHGQGQYARHRERGTVEPAFPPPPDRQR